jgi:hypothetical protein
LLTVDCGTSTGSRLVQAAFGKPSIEGLTIEVMLRVASLQLEASADLSGRTLGSASNGDRRDIHCLVCLTH